MQSSEYVEKRSDSKFSLRNVMSIVSQFIIGVFNIKRPVERKQKRELNKEIEELEAEHHKNN